MSDKFKEDITRKGMNAILHSVFNAGALFSVSMLQKMKDTGNVVDKPQEDAKVKELIDDIVDIIFE